MFTARYELQFYIIQVILSLNPRSDYVRSVEGKAAMRKVFLWELPFFLVNIIPPLHVHTHLHLHVAITRRTNEQSLRTFQKELIFWKLESSGQKIPLLSLTNGYCGT